MAAVARQIIWVAPSTRDVNQISSANDSQTLTWRARPRPNRGTTGASIREISFDQPFPGLTPRSLERFPGKREEPFDKLSSSVLHGEREIDDVGACVHGRARVCECEVA